MPKVYAKHPGAEIRIGNYGTATYEVPAEVPDNVALELVGNLSLETLSEDEIREGKVPRNVPPNPDVRVEVEAPAPRLARKAHKEEKEG